MLQTMALVIYIPLQFVPIKLLFVIVLWEHNSQGIICVYNQSHASNQMKVNFFHGFYKSHSSFKNNILLY